MDDTKSQLIQAALVTVRQDGLAAASARTIAARAQVNQALIFYHFNTVTQLIEAASNAAVEESVRHYRDALAGVETLSELLEVGRDLHERETTNGNVALMAQLMAGAQHDPVLARATHNAMAAWTHQIEEVLQRVLRASPLAGLLDLGGLAPLISAGFIGLELYDGVDAPGAMRALATLEELGQLIQVLDDSGPVATRALLSKIRSARRRKPRP
ncbi:MAG: TetR family transcriptional regulator [Actinomycetota bacterium]|nr:TetR family transcriptional regulator [Actinomycetota bacterium]MDQ2958761.1 TetR family transcriptional regulator [Actinomycetota bacterium]